MTDQELDQLVTDLADAKRLQKDYPTSSIGNIVQQIESRIKNESKRRQK